MSVQLAKTPYSVPFTKWFFSHLFPVGFSKYDNDLIADLQGPFDETFESDGINISDGSYTLASEFTDPATLNKPDTRSIRDPLSVRYLFSFLIKLLGLPSRPSTIVHVDDGTRQQPIMYFKQFVFNFIGDWDSDPKISTEKKVWQWLSLPFKIFIILPIKILLMPIKLLINWFKLIIEWLPLLFGVLIARALGAYRSTALGSAFFSSLAEWRSEPGISILRLLLVGLFKIPHLVLGTLYFAFRLIALVGRAIASPEKSIRMAFNYGRELKIEFGGSEAGKWFGHLISNTIGLLGALISLSITAFFWIFLLPLGFSFITAHFPLIVRLFTWIAQLPPVAFTTTWFSQVPLITTSLGLAQSALTSVGLIISSVFGPTITTIGAAIGLKISVGLMLTGTSLGLIAAIVAPALTKAGDYLSNLWVSWTNGGPFTALFSLCSTQDRQSKPITVSNTLMRAIPLSEEDRKNAVPVSEDGDTQLTHYVEDSDGKVEDYDEEQAPTQDVKGLQKKMNCSVEHANQAANIKSTEYHRPAQQGFLESAKDFGDYFEYEQPYQRVEYV